MRSMRTLGSAIVLALILSAGPVLAQTVGASGGGGVQAAQTFYVSSSGSDSNSGTTPASPWLTIAKVNAATFTPGSTVNLMTNLTGCFSLSATNTAGPLTITSYGGVQVTVTCGAASQNVGANYVAHLFDSINGMTVNNVKFTNPNADAGTFSFPHYQFGLLFENSTGTSPISANLTNSTVTGYSNDAAFLFASAQSNWITCGAGFNGITVTGNTLGGTSVSSTDVAALGIGGYDFNITDAFCHSQDATKIQNVLVANNTLAFAEGSSTLNNNWPFASVGVEISNASNVLINNNYIHDIGANMNLCPGPQGTWDMVTNFVTWTHNEVALVGPTNGVGASCDQGGINPGEYDLNQVVEYNYIHDINGGGILLQPTTFSTVGGPGWSATVAYNVIENARFGSIDVISSNQAGHNFLPYKVYNNTLIQFGGTECFIANGGTANGMTGSIFENNICFDTYLNSNHYLVKSAETATTTFNNNLYFLTSLQASTPWKNASTTYATLALWRTACSCDAASVFVDAGITTEPTMPTQVASFAQNCSVGLTGQGVCPVVPLYSGSGGVRTGVAISGSPGLDYYGAPVTSTPSIGASQAPIPKTNITFDTSANSAATTVSLTTAGTNELIFAGAATNGAASCTVADTAGLTWTSLGAGGTGTNIVSGFEAFAAGKLTADTITFTCASQTFIQTAVMAFKGARNIHDSAAGLPATGTTTATVSSAGPDGVIAAFMRETVSVGYVDNGFTAPVNTNFLIAEYHLFGPSVLQTNVLLGGVADNAGTVADIWH